MGLDFRAVMGAPVSCPGWFWATSGGEVVTIDTVENILGSADMTKPKKVLAGPEAQSLQPDNVMRPWTINEGLEKKIIDEIIDLDNTVTLMSPQSAMKGNSEIDKIPAELKELRDYMESNPNWIEEHAHDLDLIGQLMDNFEAANEELGTNGSKNTKGGVDRDETISNVLNTDVSPSKNDKGKILLKTIRDLNDLLKNKDKPINQFFRMTGKKNERKPTLKSIRYKPRAGPAVFAGVSTAKFQRFLTKQGLILATAKEKKKLTADDIAELRSISEAQRMEKWATQALDLVSGSYDDDDRSRPSMQYSASMPSLLSLAESNITFTSPLKLTRVSDSTNDSCSFTVSRDVQTTPSLTLIKTQPSTNTLAQSGIGISSIVPNLNLPASPIKVMMPSKDILSELPPIMSLSKNVNTSRPTTAPVISARSLSSRMRPSSEGRFDLNSKTNSALNKLGISGHTGTSKVLFSRPHCLEMKKLKDQLMTTTGSFALNVHPDASPDNVANSLESLSITKKQAHDCVERNRLDQTWTILQTPGYYEAVGPEKIYLSDSHTFHTTNAAFEKAVREADVSNGINGDAITRWVENAAENKVKIFVSGGAMKI